MVLLTAPETDGLNNDTGDTARPSPSQKDDGRIKYSTNCTLGTDRLDNDIGSTAPSAPFPSAPETDVANKTLTGIKPSVAHNDEDIADAGATSWKAPESNTTNKNTGITASSAQLLPTSPKSDATNKNCCSCLPILLETKSQYLHRMSL